MIRLAIVVLCISMGAVAQPAEYLSGDDAIIFHAFNGDYHTADSLLDVQFAADEDLPRYHYLASVLAFYSRYFGATSLNRDSLREDIGRHAQKAIALAEELEETPENTFYLGSAYSMLSRYYVLHQDLYESYFAARKADNLLDDVLDDSPDFHDAKLNLAIMGYFTSTRLTGFQSSLAWMLGMLGDKEESMTWLHEVAQDGDLCQAEARFVLTQLYRFLEPNPELARVHYESFSQDFPDNRTIANQLLQMDFTDLVSAEGADYVAEHIDSLRVVYNIDNPNVLNGLGYSFVNEEQLDVAEKLFRLNIDLWPNYSNGYDSLAEILIAQGKSEEAREKLMIGMEKLEADTLINDQFRENVREAMQNNLERLNAM